MSPLKRFQSSRDIDAIAENIVAVNDDIANVDSHLICFSAGVLAMRLTIF